MSVNKKYKLMVVGAAALQMPLIKRIKERGYELVVVSPNPTEPGFEYADYSVIADVRDQDLILEKARELKIDGAVTDQTDLAVRTVAYVTEKMGLSSIGYNISCLFTDKVLMRKKCKELDLNPIPYALVHNLYDAIEFYDTLGAPAIIKPADSQASKGVHKITCRQDMIMYFKEAMDYSRNGKVIIEKFINGFELLVDSLIVDGEIKVLTIGEYTPFAKKDVFSIHMTIFQSKCPKDVKEKVSTFNNQIIKKFGLNNSRTHAEYLYDGEKCYLVEIAARGGGVFISSDAVKFCAGISTEDFLIDAAVGNLYMPEPSSDFVGQYFGELFFYMPEGEIISIEGIEEVLKLPFVHNCLLTGIEVGIKTPPITDKNGRKLFTLTGNSYDELEKRMCLIKSMIDIKVRTDNGIEGIIWS